MLQRSFLILAMLSLVVAPIGVLPVATAHAQQTESIFPTDPSLWINSPPLTNELIEGKGVFLWFFEES